MNANELADWLDKQAIVSFTGYFGEPLELAADIIRQQQAELDAFKLNYYNTGYSLQLRDKDETIKQQQAEIKALKKKIPDWENIRKPNSNIGNLDKEPYVYKMGDIDWTKALK